MFITWYLGFIRLESLLGGVGHKDSAKNDSFLSLGSRNRKYWARRHLGRQLEPKAFFKNKKPGALT